MCDYQCGLVPFKMLQSFLTSLQQVFWPFKMTGTSVILKGESEKGYVSKVCFKCMYVCKGMFLLTRKEGGKKMTFFS